MSLYSLVSTIIQFFVAIISLIHIYPYLHRDDKPTTTTTSKSSSLKSKIKSTFFPSSSSSPLTSSSSSQETRHDGEETLPIESQQSSSSTAVTNSPYNTSHDAILMNPEIQKDYQALKASDDSGLSAHLFVSPISGVPVNKEEYEKGQRRRSKWFFGLVILSGIWHFVRLCWIVGSGIGWKKRVDGGDGNDDHDDSGSGSGGDGRWGWDGIDQTSFSTTGTAGEIKGGIEAEWKAKTIEEVLMVFFWMFVGVGVWEGWGEERRGHKWRVTSWEAFLMSLSTVFLIFRLVTVPSTVPEHEVHPLPPEPLQLKIENIIDLISLILSFLAWCIATTTPHGPSLYYEQNYKTHSFGGEVEPREDEGGKPSPVDEEQGHGENRSPLMANVAGLSSASPLSYSLFIWVDPVLRVLPKSKRFQLFPSDVPKLTKEFRAENLWVKMRAILRDQGRIELENKKRRKNGDDKNLLKGGAPEWMNPLLYMVWKANKKTFWIQWFLAVVTAFLYYMPAFFLNRFVKFLERPAPAVEGLSAMSTGIEGMNDQFTMGGNFLALQPKVERGHPIFFPDWMITPFKGVANGTWMSNGFAGVDDINGLDSSPRMTVLAGSDGIDKSWSSMSEGYLYALGLFIALILDALISGMLWYLSNSMLTARIKVQLNSCIFEKTLKRKNVASTGASDEKKEAEGEGRGFQDDAGVDEENVSHVAEPGEISGPGGGPILPTTAPSAQSVNGIPTSGEPERGTTKSKRGVSAKAEKRKKKGMFETEDEGFKTKSTVLNLFVVDVDRISEFAMISFSIIDAPCELLLGTIFLYKLLGYSSLIGIGMAIVFMPLNHWTAKRFATVQDRLMTARDQRVGIMNEVLQSIRMLKFMSWERPFEERIMKARAEELKQQRRNYHLEVSFNFLWTATPIICILITFLCFTKLQGGDLTPSTAFSALAVFNELKFALNVIPETFVDGLQCLISLRRVTKYLESDEIDPSLQVPLLEGPRSEEENVVAPVGFRNATITWPTEGRNMLASTPSSTQFIMSDLDISFPEGKLSLVCGNLGSGKTLLLLALLGEAELLSGQIQCPRSPPSAITLASSSEEIDEKDWIQKRCAFVPQSAWLQNASLRENIVFGLPFHEARYRATLQACSLVPDLTILEDGDQTEIGEKGVGLSGGQKARVSLARAVYSRASTILLDDVLAAVDAHTAHHIFTECLQGPLMQGRTLILVSHHVQLCAPGAAHVVALEDGKILFQGKDFINTDVFKRLLGNTGQEEGDEALDVLEDEPVIKPKNKNLRIKEEDQGGSSGTSDTTTSSSEDDESDEETKEDDQSRKAPRKLIEEESRAVGRVGASVWTYYLGANGGAIFWAVFLFVFIGTKGMDVLETWWLRLWSGSRDSGKTPKHSTDFYLAFYAIICLLNVTVGTIRWLYLYEGGYRASTRLYQQILRNILRAPLRFFDTMAHGRLLNRFGKDFETIDAQLPDHYGRTFIYGLSALTVVATVSSTAPAFFVAFIFIAIAYYYYGRLYTSTARELRRLDSVSKSPVYSIYGEAIDGSAVIRAFGASSKFMGTMCGRVTDNVSFFFFLWCTNRWLSVRFSLLSSLFVGLTGIFLLAGTSVRALDAAMAGFALSWALEISHSMLFLVRRYTALELALVAVERIQEYSLVKSEAPEFIEPRPPASWPHAGEIHVDKLEVRYAPELPSVLKSLSFDVKAGKKVGIVGPTGCGKSTLALSFFRFVEAWSGQIVLDGIDISKVGLTDLRSRITIIPQDPTILSGTLRSTLDVFDEYSDVEIYDALRRVHLIREDLSVVSSGPTEELSRNQLVFRNLESEVTENGSNFSQGQRQLLCMARALLKRSKLLLLDEATASIDYETDELISTTIRKEFADSTLLVIAHRLRTVIDFDRILVLEEGRVIEYDKPAALLARPDSKFFALCRSTGKSEFKTLKRMAEGRAKAKPPRRKSTRRRSSVNVPPPGRSSSK